MQIKLYGNGHSCNIPVQEIIDKYWKDETAPFSFEMSTAIGDETIAATAMLGEENPDTYPSIRLDSRNARKDSSATWFILETPNETNPYVTGYAYAGNDETEGDSWITKIVDVPRDDDDDSKRLVYVDNDLIETVDIKTASKLNTKYPSATRRLRRVSHQARACGWQRPFQRVSERYDAETSERLLPAKRICGTEW